MSFIEEIKQRAKQDIKTIILPEAQDIRTLKATEQVLKEGYAKIILVGNKEEIEEKALENKIDISGAQIIEPTNSEKYEEYVNLLFELRKQKGMSLEKAKGLVKDPVYFGMLMLKDEKSEADGLVSGAIHSTADTLRPALQPKVAMLSYSTYGSAKSESTEKVIRATEKVREKDKNLLVDGELQLDSAIIPEVANFKAPGSPIEGNANVLIFPDLNAGNIGYKLVQRLGKAEAYGPLCQGIATPVNDLSRGCTSNDIAGVIAITAVQAQEK